MGPNLIIDKSLLHALSTREIAELAEWFEIVTTPPLLNEVIADLRHPDPGMRVSQETVALLAHKLNTGSATLEPLQALDIAYTEFMSGKRVPMNGGLPIGGPNVRRSADGTMVMYDSTPLQEQFWRMASGQFTNDEFATAEEWRANSGKMNLPALRKKWKPFVVDTLGNPDADINAIVRAVDAFTATPDVAIQSNLFELLCDMLAVGRAYREKGVAQLAAQSGETRLIRDLRPYCMSILRLMLTYVSALARGAWGERQTDEIDLDYLYYAPFCLAFASSDKFHRSFWHAATSRGFFLWGPDLRSDLQGRMKRRSEMTSEDWLQHRRMYGHFPWPSPNSPIENIYNALGKPHPYDPENLPEIPPEVERDIFDRLKALENQAEMPERS